jgi:hypothetical protein
LEEVFGSKAFSVSGPLGALAGHHRLAHEKPFGEAEETILGGASDACSTPEGDAPGAGETGNSRLVRGPEGEQEGADAARLRKVLITQVQRIDGVAMGDGKVVFGVVPDPEPASCQLEVGECKIDAEAEEILKEFHRQFKTQTPFETLAGPPRLVAALSTLQAGNAVRALEFVASL